MFSLNKLVLFTLLSFALMVHSVPLHHSQHGPAHRMHKSIKRRSASEGSCRHKSSSTVAEPTPVSSKANNDYHADPTPTTTKKHSSSSSSSAEPTPTEDSGNNNDGGDDSGNTDGGDNSGNNDENTGVVGGLLKSLFPIGASDRSWSTADGAKNFKKLSDDSLSVFSVMNALSHGMFILLRGIGGRSAYNSPQTMFKRTERALLRRSTLVCLSIITTPKSLMLTAMFSRLVCSF